MRRLHRFIHVARIAATADPRISNLGLPNVEMELPAARDIDSAAGVPALYVTVSCDVLNRPVAREGRGIVHSCVKREYKIVILDMKLVSTADACGIRWLAQLKSTADWYRVALQTRLSPTLALVLKTAGIVLPEFAPSRFKGAAPI